MAYAAMPNHVHVLIDPFRPIRQITHWIKGSTARAANELLARSGKQFWQHESFDHWVRDDSEGQRIIRYIERNPVKAGLVQRIEDWPWSSAYAPSSASFSLRFTS